MIHIVFQPRDAEALKASFLLDAGLQGDVLVIADDFAVGPLSELSRRKASKRAKHGGVESWQAAILTVPSTTAEWPMTIALSPR